MSIKLIALDMDGTLLGADHKTVPPENVESLREASRRGVKIAIASGRSWSLIHETAEELGCVDYGITANGAYVLDTATGQTMVRSPMDAAQCLAAIDILRRRELFFELYINGQNYVQEDDVEHLYQFALSEEFTAMFLRNMTVAQDVKEAVRRHSVEKFDVFYVPPEMRQDVLAELETTGPMAFTGALDGNLELTASEVNKGAALSALAGKLGLSPAEVMAFGDAGNDLEMLSWAEWSFAMENGTDAAKRAARYLAPPNHAGGVGRMVAQYVLK